ncbi:hypothetical protein [Kitasatospora sp. SUK 42]|uniref:hypothetical protein n=1 Tax=Kitasatospora sp. SUK 42 TaxID=1588882 RepID=UPI001C31E8FB|nr:hypothetical protein [Kitasatospora sp. SUK 42]
MVVTASAVGTATATCPNGFHAVGGGFQGLSADITSSVPVGGSPPVGWQVTTLATEVTVYVVCTP